jgi:RHS repeat-associated protein
MSLSASAVQGEQLYDPYGSHRYAEGTLGTDKGYTGQFIDAATGLAYDHARSYLRHIGVFLSPDSVQGNAQGMDPYAYVGGNPETKTDPTGQVIVGGGCDPTKSKCGGGGGGHSGGSPNPGPGSGGCNKGYHPEKGDGMCVQDGSNCPGDMKLGKGGCVYTDNGACTGMTVQGCQQYKQEQRQKELEGEKNAAHDANNAVTFFGRLSALFALLASLLGFISAANWLSPLGWITAGLAVGFAILAFKAFMLASAFQDEANGNLSWFTKANLADQENKMDMDLESSLPPLFAGEMSMFAQMGGAAAAKVESIFSQAAGDALGGGSMAGLVAVGTDFLGTQILVAGVAYSTNQQEGDLSM